MDKNLKIRWLNTNIFGIFLTAVTIMLVVFLLILNSVSAEETNTTGLFSARDQPEGFSRTEAESVIRTRYVTIDFDILRGHDTGYELAEDLPPTALTLNLFPDLTLTASLVRFETNCSGSKTWIGIINGNPYSHVSMTYKDNVLSGGISSPLGFFTIRPVMDDIHLIYQSDPTKFIPAGEALVPDIQSQGEVTVPAGPLTEDGSFIDVMVLYTDDALASQGSEIAMELLVETAVQATNQAYINSGITQRLRLVHTREVPYTEPDEVEDMLSCIKQPFDSCLDDFLLLRDFYGADIVTLIYNHAADNISGLAYFMKTVSHDFENWAFNVVDVDAINGPADFFVYAHELGHNMGGMHEWFDEDRTEPYTYSHGYVPPSCAWTTIMAIGAQCAGVSPNWDTVLYYSNPNITYVPPNVTPAPTPEAMGVPGGTNTSCTTGNLINPLCDADMARTLNETAYTVANFRQTKLKTLVYVDDDAAWFGDGTAEDPYWTVDAGVGLVLPGGTVYIMPGSYNSIMVISKPMTLEAPSGNVTIGQ